MEGDYTSTEVKARYNDFNPLPPHGGRPKTDPKKHTYQQISIHSLRMEGDPAAAARKALALAISIHSLRMEGDKKRQCNGKQHFHFNPLPPHGGRHKAFRSPSNRCYFNPLPPHGGRRCIKRLLQQPQRISIHSLRMEGDKLIRFWAENK